MRKPVQRAYLLGLQTACQRTSLQRPIELKGNRFNNDVCEHLCDTRQI